MHPDVKRRSHTHDPRYDLGGTGVPGRAGARRAPHRSDIRFASVQHMARDAPVSLGSISGYTGHVPGKLSENVIGSTNQKANELATASRNFTPAWKQMPLAGSSSSKHIADRATPTGPGVRTSSEPSWRMQHYGHEGTGYSHTVKVPVDKPEDFDIKGASTVGYKGFIPGKVAENVYGQPVARTNRIAQDRRVTPAYSPPKEACGFLSQTAPAFWAQGSDYPTIRNSMVSLSRNMVRSDILPIFTEKERSYGARGSLHRTMGFRSDAPPPIHRDQFMWGRPRRRDAYEREISYQPPEPPYQGRTDPFDVAKVKGPAGEPSHTIKMDQMRQKLEYLQRNPDREMGTRT